MGEYLRNQYSIDDTELIQHKKSENPKISIIIPVYNVEKYIKQSLNSVVNQTLEDIEIIVVNDCSPDNSMIIVHEYARVDKRIRIINQEINQGQGVARNRALDCACGKYIMFLDPDDWLELDACEKLYNQIETNKNDIVFFNLYVYDEKRKKKKYLSNRFNEFGCIKEKPNINLKTFRKQWLKTGWTVTQIYSKTFLDTNNICYSSERFGEDFLFFIKSVICSNSVSITDLPLYNYRINKKEAVTDYSKYYENLFSSKEKALNLILNSEYKEHFMFIYLPYQIKSDSYWLKKFCRMNKNIRDDLYHRMREKFITLNEIYDIDSIKQYINFYEFQIILKSENYKEYFFNSLKEKMCIKFTSKILKIKNKLKLLKTTFSYRLKKLQLKYKFGKRKIRVLFYVTENQKWGYQSLYRLLEKDSCFTPVIVVSVLQDVHTGHDLTRNNIEENYNFFKSQGMNVEYGYKNNRYVNLKSFNPDIVFYEQKWQLPKSHRPQNVSKFALTCFSSYSFQLFDDKNDYTQDFHKLLYKNFVDNEYNLNRYNYYKKNNSRNCTLVGYSKLDVYLDKEDIDLKKYWREPDKIKVIYAPHHSFESNGGKLATFKQNGRFILELAKKYPQTTWIFSPHPRFKYALLSNNIMTEEDIENYYEEWGSIGKINLEGNYFNMFKSSDLMISDCASFLAEYLPSGHPLIRPVNRDSIMFNQIGEKIVEGYYQVENNNELKEVFDDLIISKNDFKKDLRKQLVNIIVDTKQKSSKKIYDILIKELS